ncbi:MAG TPA: hypothetical protein VKA46_19020 [Gemmataceae bacterium]|nr:hypothetical protein [Gemmataceae bacterium]
MTIAESNQVNEVVRRVQSWPASLRIALARRILETLENGFSPEPAPALPRGPSAAEVEAMFETDKPAPDDATVKQWIDEYRMTKYGK